MKHLKSWIAVPVVLLLLQGCKPKSPALSDPVADKYPSGSTHPAPNKLSGAQAAPLDPATLGNISGTVHLKGTPPAPVRIDTSMDPACALSSAPDFNSEQYVVSNGELANVYIYVKSGPTAAINAPATATAPVVLDQKGCRYTPHVIAVMHDQSVSFQNSDLTMHNIHTMPISIGSGNETIDISQGPKAAPIVRRFAEPEIMLPVRCNNHPWMNAFINVSATPFFAVSDASGHFDLKGLPAGQYILGAVHEKLGEQTLEVTVTRNSTAKEDFTFAMK